MRFQIIVTPASMDTPSTEVPYGALYIAASLIKCGHEVRIESCDTEKFGYAELSRRIKEYKPDVIGISSVLAMSYKYVKETTLCIKREFPHIKIIVGGGLSATGQTLLQNSGTDIIVIGEGDVTIAELADKISKKEPYNDIAGIVFKEGDHMVETHPRTPIRNMDILEYPAFDLVKMPDYFIDMGGYVRAFRSHKHFDKRLFEPHRSKKMLRIMISRGCVNQCTFCYRPVLGLRHFSFDYIFDYIEYLIDRFHINIFSFGDECFSASKKWSMEFLEALNKRKLNIMFQVMGMRVDVVDDGILRAFKDAGCFNIMYGIESGSQRMLNIMEKRTTVQKNIDVIRWTKQAGILTAPNFLFGMPGETTETIKETIEFLKKIDYGMYRYQYAYALAVPGTPLYEYAKISGLIVDEDKYLEKLSYATVHNLTDTDAFINFTSEKFGTVKNWADTLKDELLRYYSRHKVFYFINKYLRPGPLFFSLKNLGFSKTFREIISRIFKREEKIGDGTIAVMPESSPERARYLRIVKRYIDDTKEGVGLRRVIQQIENDKGG